MKDRELSIENIIINATIGAVFIIISTILIIIISPKCVKISKKRKKKKKRKSVKPIKLTGTLMRKKSRYAFDRNFEKDVEEATAISTKSIKEEPDEPRSESSKKKNKKKTKKSKKIFDKELKNRHKKYMVDKKKADKEAENLSKFKKMGRIHIPKEATNDTFLQNCKNPQNIVLDEAYFDEALNEQYDIGTDIDDVELDETATTTTYGTTVTLYHQ